MKKILFIYSKKHLYNCQKRIHSNWVNDCKDIYDIQFWGSDFNENISKKSLIKTINDFKPDYIYLTHRRTVCKWLPDLTDIDIPKIFVEVDSYKYDVNDPWYKQFTKVYCRQPHWFFNHSTILDYNYYENYLYKHKNKCFELLKKNNKKEILKNHDNNYYLKIQKLSSLNKKDIEIKATYLSKKFKENIIKEKTWNNISLFRWSIPEKYINFNYSIKNSNNILFIGRCNKKLYPMRLFMKNNIKDIFFINDFNEENYLKNINSASALVCPTESLFGDFVPAKIFEYASSGAAILTNCDLKSYNMEDLDKVVIKYTDIKDLKEKLTLDFTKYHNKTREIMKNHTQNKI